MHAASGEGKDRCIVLRKAGGASGADDHRADAVGSALAERYAVALQEEALDHVSRQAREAERRREQKDQQVQKKMQMQQQKLQQQQQKERQQTVLSGAAFLLDSLSLPDAADAVRVATAAAELSASVVKSIPESLSSAHSPASPAAAAPDPQIASPPSPSSLAIGQPVRLSGLSTEWLNGAHGVIASALDASTGRCLVKIHAPKEAVAKCNVRRPAASWFAAARLIPAILCPLYLQGEAKLKPENLEPIARASNVAPVSDVAKHYARCCRLIV